MTLSRVSQEAPFAEAWTRAAVVSVQSAIYCVTGSLGIAGHDVIPLCRVNEEATPLSCKVGSPTSYISIQISQMVARRIRQLGKERDNIR